MNNDAEGKKEIKGIEWMGASCVQPMKEDAGGIIKLSLPSISRK
ncbi:hypothetical protein [Pseudomonas psychrophila]|nr:hypothetical protein [Pseudomonas psychrophila]